MDRQTNTLDEASILLLRKIVEASYGLTAGVKAIKFRADNHQYRSTIDSLVQARYIVERNEKYFVTLIALQEIGFETPQIVDLLSWCERLFKFMRQAYLDNPGEEIKVSELVRLTALTNQQIATCISFMGEASLLGGCPTDFYASNATVRSAERILDYKSFAQVIEVQSGFALKTGAKSKSANHSLAFPLLSRLGEAGDFSHLLHPKIIEHALPKYQDGHLRNAVLDSVIAVFDLIRQRTGLGDDGDKLIGKAFSLTKPYLILSEIGSESGKNDQGGFIQILKGVYQGIRNPKAHSLSSNLTKIEAAQYLVLASLLARRVEEAVLVEQANDEMGSASH